MVWHRVRDTNGKMTCVDVSSLLSITEIGPGEIAVTATASYIIAKELYYYYAWLYYACISMVHGSISTSKVGVQSLYL